MLVLLADELHLFTRLFPFGTDLHVSTISELICTFKFSLYPPVNMDSIGCHPHRRIAPIELTIATMLSFGMFMIAQLYDLRMQLNPTDFAHNPSILGIVWAEFCVIMR